MNRVGKAVLLVLALSCSPSFPVADGAQISCASNAECPEGWACNTSRSLCVPAGQTDATAPVITDFAAHPARVAAGVTLHVDFAVSEDIQARRVNARLVAPDGSTRPLACSSADARGFSCTRLIDGSEAPAGTNTPHSVLVTVEDEAANPATASTAVLLDFEPPRVAAAQPSYQPAPGNPLGAVSAAKEGTRLSLTLSASEALDVSRLPTLVARQGAGALAFTLMPGSFGPGGATFTATIPPGTADGRYLPSVTWRDVAGNEATEELKAAELRVLTSAPVLLVRQAQVQLLRSPLGGEAAEVVGGAPIPAGPYFALTPRHPLTAPAALLPDTFSLATGALRRVRI